MQNNEALQRIMQKSSNNWHNSSQSSKNEGISISKIRIISAKYKMYSVLLFIGIVLFWLIYIPAAQSTYNTNKDKHSQAKSNLELVKQDIQIAQSDEEFLKEIITKESDLKVCLNGWNQTSCDNLPESWEYPYKVPMSYLQLHSLYNKKMPVDEKKVLKNLNEYLIREDLGDSKTIIWDITSINIWNPSSIWDNHFFSVPVSVTIEFRDISDLTWFLYNVEKKMINSGDDRILYKIQAVSYDVIANNEPQTTTLEMTAYYYHDDKFENIDESIILDEANNGIVIDENMEDAEENESRISSFFSSVKDKFSK